MNLRSLCLAAIVAACSVSAHAAFHLWRIDQIYSNSDGEVQYIVLRESSGTTGEDRLSGHPLTTTNGFGQQKSMTFATNLPSTQTASRMLLIATPG